MHDQKAMLNSDFRGEQNIELVCTVESSLCLELEPQILFPSMMVISTVTLAKPLNISGLHLVTELEVGILDAP